VPQHPATALQHITPCSPPGIPCPLGIPMRGTGKRAPMQVTVALCKDVSFTLPMSRTAGDGHGRTTFRSCPFILSFSSFQAVLAYAYLRLVSLHLLTGMQVNNVIIAGSGEDEY
jgi:hypothetical protein